MPLTFAQLKERAANLAKLEGWTDVSPAPDWAFLINRAYEFFSWDAEFFVGVETITSVAGQSEYTTIGSYKAFLDITVAGAPVLRSTEAFERNLRADWRTQPPGTPQRWVLSNFTKLTLVPAPALNGQPILVRGIALPPALTLENDVPVAPALYHESIALRAAILHGELYAQGEAMNRLALYTDGYNKSVAQCRQALNTGYERREHTEV